MAASKTTTPDSQQIAIARLGAVEGDSDNVSNWVDVHFNPASLQLQVSNELKDTKNNLRKQYVAKANAKLTMELQFDTTETGAPVTDTTQKLQAFVAPPLSKQDKKDIPPPVVIFEWGSLKFKGIAENYKETIDFFSASGVPLRASVNLTLSRQDQVFEKPDKAPPAATTNKELDVSAASASEVAKQGAAPQAARGVAAANGQENLRFGNGLPMTVSPTVNLKPPASFSAAPAIGSGLGVDIGIGISAGPGISGLARLAASEGAFNGLGAAVHTGPSAAHLNLSRLRAEPASATVSTDRGASFQVGGKATLEGPSGLRANVGKLTFGEP